MKNSIIALILILFVCVNILNAQDEGLFSSSGNSKSAIKAMLFSSLVPGAGQVYVNHKRIVNYIFPIVEIAAWYGYLHYDKKGDDKTDEYKDYADEHYLRSRQHFVQDYIWRKCVDGYYRTDLYYNSDATDWQDTNYFLLDDTNTQHFYEDIGKYNKYIYGWDDWFHTYCDTTNGFEESYQDPSTWDDEEYCDQYLRRRLSEEFITIEDSLGEIITGPFISANRDTYISMRQDAEDFYSTSDLFEYTIIFNHIFSAIDAVIMANRHNRIYSYNESKWDVNIKTTFRSNKLTPELTITRRF
ncbi:MAG: hypothetical protein DRH57_02480 [Candidatus Cloacimonadota bacterium]|nr:MAG: hypothetical protein DRH57_02480 [Candidatus Cloacimonadota bacterium]